MRHVQKEILDLVNVYLSVGTRVRIIKSPNITASSRFLGKIAMIDCVEYGDLAGEEYEHRYGIRLLDRSRSDAIYWVSSEEFEIL